MRESRAIEAFKSKQDVGVRAGKPVKRDWRAGETSPSPDAHALDVCPSRQTIYGLGQHFDIVGETEVEARALVPATSKFRIDIVNPLRVLVIRTYFVLLIVDLPIRTSPVILRPEPQRVTREPAYDASRGDSVNLRTLAWLSTGP